MPTWVLLERTARPAALLIVASALALCVVSSRTVDCFASWLASVPSSATFRERGIAGAHGAANIVVAQDVARSGDHLRGR